MLTEIDIQTPSRKSVQELRKGRSFLFLGCRFSTQMERMFARQIMKRSSEKHWAVLPEEPTRNEARFLEQFNIERIAHAVERVRCRLPETRQLVQLMRMYELSSHSLHWRRIVGFDTEQRKTGTKVKPCI